MITTEKLKKWAEVQSVMSGEEIDDRYLQIMLALSNRGFTVGKDVELFRKGEKVERLLVDPIIRALIMKRLDGEKDCLEMIHTLKTEWEIDDPFMTLKNEVITKEVANKRPYILDITDDNENDYRIFFAAYATLSEALTRAKKILTDPKFKRTISKMDGEPCLGIHVLGDELDIYKGNLVNVWGSMIYDLNVTLWQIALWEKLAIEKQTLEVYRKICARQPITLEEFGQLLIA